MDVFKAAQTQDYGDALAIEDHAVDRSPTGTAGNGAQVAEHHR